MDSPKILSYLFVILSTAAGTCFAQDATHNPPIRLVPLGDTRPIQIQRCENLGALVSKAAIARDSHQSESHFVGQFAQTDPGPGIDNLIHKVFASNESPEAWQARTLAECKQKVS